MKSNTERARQQLAQRIEELKAEATRLEQERGLSAKAAVEAVAEAKALRQQAKELASGGFETERFLASAAAEVGLRDRQAEEAAARRFSAEQQQVNASMKMERELVAQAMQRVVYSMAVGVDQRTIERNVLRVLRGEGTPDGKGGRYVTFADGRGPEYKVIQDTDGYFGVVLASAGE